MVFYGGTFVVPDASTIHDDLLQMCRQLHTLMAANWTLLEGAQASSCHLDLMQISGKSLCNRWLYVSTINSAEAEQRVTEKEASLAPNLAILETAHGCTNGKAFRCTKFTSANSVPRYSKNICSIYWCVR